jgi:hypothetical protein
VPEGGTLYDTSRREAVAGGQPKNPELVKDYEYYQKQTLAAGGTPKTFDAWDLERKKAGAPGIVFGGENEQAKDLGKARATLTGSLRKGADDAYGEIGSINIMRQAMKDPNVYSGIGAEAFALPIKQAIVALGVTPFRQAQWRHLGRSRTSRSCKTLAARWVPIYPTRTGILLRRLLADFQTPRGQRRFA